jgi:tetratricopeptide (TPR) repeat protein
VSACILTADPSLSTPASKSGWLGAPVARDDKFAKQKAQRPGWDCSKAKQKRYNKEVRIGFLILVLALLGTFSRAQDTPDKPAPAQDKPAADKNAPPAPDAGESSSHATRIDLSPPKDDEKSHPSSKAALENLDIPLAPDKGDTSGVQEFHPWNPMKAMKDVEVGDFYFKRKNYKAALERYKDALYYKDNDAVASYRLAVCQEKLGDKAEAQKYFEQYLKILPDGPLAKEAHASLARLAKAQ